MSQEQLCKIVHMANAAAVVAGAPYSGNMFVQDDETGDMYMVGKTGLPVGPVFNTSGGLSSSSATMAIADSMIGGRHTTKFTFTNKVVPITSVTTGPGTGSVKLLDMPAGYIALVGAVGSVAVSVATAKQADFTDATPEGDIGIGSAAMADADALGTDATDDDFCTAAPFTMANYASPAVALAPEPAARFDGHTTPVAVYANVFVDAADIDDGVSTEVLLNGTLTIVWDLLGDN